MSGTRPTIDLWSNNEIQFARLLCELMANWVENSPSRTIEEVADAMDLTVDDVHDLLDRALEVWEDSKARFT